MIFIQCLRLGLVLSSRFHLLCIITPYDVDLNSINFSLFHEEYENLTKGEKELLNKSGVTLEKIINSMSISTKLVCFLCCKK